MNTKSKKGIIGITLAIIMIASIFAMVAPTAVAEGPNAETEHKVDFYPNSTINIYGEVGFAPDAFYEDLDWQAPFNPTVIPKDSITFNPAIIDHAVNPVHVFPNTTANLDGDLKTYLRMWYEPAHKYEGLFSGYTLQTHSYPSIMVEYTYAFLKNKGGEKYPAHITVNATLPFPIAEIADQTGLGSTMNDMETISYEPDKVIVTEVGGVVTTHNKTTGGWVQLEKKYVTLNATERVQFMDHKLTFIGTSMDTSIAIVDIEYAGNEEDDTKKRTIMEKDQLYYFDRHNGQYTAATHPERTWKARYTDKTDKHEGIFDVGKVLAQGDTFYVDGVRYDIPAIEAIDTNGDGEGDEIKYITIRTPLPKCPDLSNTAPKRDDSVVSSQWLDCIKPFENLPLLPPFNAQHSMVDDIDVPLWAPTDNLANWPKGDSAQAQYVDTNGIYHENGLGIGWFPCAERYLTMQYPPRQWLEYFDAIPIGVEGMPCTGDWEGPYYPGKDLPSYWVMCACGKHLSSSGSYEVFDTSSWIAIDATQRILGGVNSTVVYYVSEGKEERYSTDLLEKLQELDILDDSLYENWTKFDIQTLPDKYTEFVVPQVPDLNITTCEGTAGEYTQMMFGDYLITTSLLGPNSIYGDLLDQRVAFSYDQKEGMDGIDIYVNDKQYYGNDTVRVYGDVNDPIETALDYGDEDWEAPFNPTWIRKDSITFDPAILLWNGSDYPMSASGKDADLKKYLRLWYEPCYPFQDSTSKWPAIVLESTYMLIEDKHKMPLHGTANTTWFAFPIAENESTEQIGLELFENVMGTPFERNLVALTTVSGNTSGHALPKTTDGLIQLEKTYLIRKGIDKIQFLDHKCMVNSSTDNGTRAWLELWYAGNKDDDTHTTTMLERGVWYYYDREGAQDTSASHPDRTWKVKFVDKTQEGDIILTVGKELEQTDIFYVDSVRYEVAAVEVIDTNNDDDGDAFKYITIRTPFPKDETGADFCTRTIDDTNSAASSIEISMIPAGWPIPVNPPFNMEHAIVDDTDVPLWVPLKHFDKWPRGDSHGTTNVEWFPNAERYLTMQRPPEAWLRFFRAVPFGVPDIPCDWQLWDNYGGPFYPDERGKAAMEAWIANNVALRIVEGESPLVFWWLNETEEPRYSTNLLQVLNETFNETGYLMNESWTKYDIQTLPDQYTEFELPEISDVVISHYASDAYRDYWKEGSYLVTTSFIAPNAKGDLNLNQTYSNVSAGTNLSRFAFIYDANLTSNLGLYMNEDPVYAEPEPVTEILLKEGWNLISLNVLPEDRSVEAIFGHEIYWYNPASGWQMPSEVEAGKGYFVYSEEDTMVTILEEGSEEVDLTWEEIEATLADGWNLVGPGVMSIYADSDYYVYKYKNNDYTIMYPTDMLEPGEGYWILKMPSTP